MKIYNYDDHGFFVGIDDADESPLEPGVFLIPAAATTLNPPITGDKERAVFNGEQWNVLADHTSDIACEIDPDTGLFICEHAFLLGETPNEKFIVADPPEKSYYKPKWNGVTWCEGLSQIEIDEVEYEKIKNAPLTVDDLMAVVTDLATRLDEKGLI